MLRDLFNSTNGVLVAAVLSTIGKSVEPCLLKSGFYLLASILYVSQ